MARLPNSAKAILDVRKLEDYCLSPTHFRGRHKARTFQATLGIGQKDAVWLREALLEAANTESASALPPTIMVSVGASTCGSRDRDAQL